MLLPHANPPKECNGAKGTKETSWNFNIYLCFGKVRGKHANETRHWRGRYSGVQKLCMLHYLFYANNITKCLGHTKVRWKTNDWIIDIELCYIDPLWCYWYEKFMLYDKQTETSWKCVEKFYWYPYGRNTVLNCMQYLVSTVRLCW